MNEILILKANAKHTLKSLTVCAFFFTVTISGAQSLRDPTIPPVVQSVVRTTSVVSTLSIGKGSPSIIVRGGRPYVVLESNLYAEGQHYGSVFIERIGETEVWFREHNVVHKIPRFSGIQRNISLPNTNALVMVPVSRQTVP